MQKSPSRWLTAAAKHEPPGNSGTKLHSVSVASVPDYRVLGAINWWF